MADFDLLKPYRQLHGPPPHEASFKRYLSDEFQKIERAINTIQKVFQAIEARIETLETTVADHETRITALEPP